MFRTELPLTPHPQQLPLSARALTIGSCFSDSIGARLAADKVTTLVNPFGTVFNPVSACRLLRAAAGEDMDWQQHVVEARGRWQSLDLHATHGAESPVELLQQVQQLLRGTGVFLATADVVVLTLGSAWVYRYKETGELISNCHKLPAEKFDKELLTPDEIINAVAETHAYLRLRNPKLRFVLTVSPVRHTKDTLPLSAVSKSVLRVACHYLSELLPDVSYFPAYELLLDDLRDYRFYAEDMLHPSKVAEDYIWERFARTYFDAGFGRFRKEWEAVRQALTHRPLYPAAPEHRQFLESTLERLERLSGQADVRMELLEVRHQIQSLPLPAVAAEPELEDDGEERIDIGEYAAPTWQAAPEPQEEAEEEEEFEQFESVREEDGMERPATADYEEATAESDAAEMLDELAPKKKRRSRGGAKRNKKKHAARLAAELETQDNSAVNTDGGLLPTLPAQPTALPAAPAVSLMADPDMAPQTAMERRKRNSRRGRGRGQQPAQAASATESAEVSVPLNTPTSLQSGHTAIAPTPAATNDIAQPTPIPAFATAPAAPEAVNEEAGPGTSQRPARTGRSASEKRADALRKPHRPASRIKSLYADVSPEDATTPPAVRQPSIPVTQGTGASGKLSESGKATLSSRVEAAPVRTEATPPVSIAAATPAVAAPTPLAAAPAVVAITPSQPQAELPQTSAAGAGKATPKPRRAPATGPKPPAPEATAATVPVPEASVSEKTEATSPTAKVPAAGRAPRKPRATPAPKVSVGPVPVAPTATTEAAAPPSVAKPSRKPATTAAPAAKKVPAAKKSTAAVPAKATAPAKASVSKRPSRPARSKPSKPDTPSGNA